MTDLNKLADDELSRIFAEECLWWKPCTWSATSINNDNIHYDEVIDGYVTVDGKWKKAIPNFCDADTGATTRWVIPWIKDHRYGYQIRDNNRNNGLIELLVWDIRSPKVTGCEQRAKPLLCIHGTIGRAAVIAAIMINRREE